MSKSNKKNSAAEQAELADLAELQREHNYLLRTAENSAAHMLGLDASSIAIRHELEHKRRGFGLLADLAFNLSRNAGYLEIFVSVARRVNAALNMQRTAVLMPDGGNGLLPVVLQGYPAEEAEAINRRFIRQNAEIMDANSPVLITGADPVDRLAELRQALELPFLIASPIVLHGEVSAVLVSGRKVELPPFLTRLNRNDVETLQSVSAYLAAMLTGQRLLEAEERTRIMLDATPLSCVFWDSNNVPLDCNEETMRLFGLTNKQEYLDNFISFSPPLQPDGSESSVKAYAQLKETLAKGACHFEWMHRSAKGEPIPCAVNLVRVRHGSGYIVLSYARDLRQEKAMLAAMLAKEAELRHAKDLAEQSDKAKSEFLANMSHEIRTPMNAILGMTHIIAGTELTEKQRNYVEQARHSANLLLHIINDILDFSKIEAGKMEIEKVEFPLRKLLANVYNTISRQAVEKGLKVRVEIAPALPRRFIGDPVRLEQVLLNISGNAVKFTREGGITLRVRPAVIDPDSTVSGDLEQARLLFEIEDSGIGMTPEQVGGLFRPFTQADSSITRKFGGTGLGLAISRSFVELMQGRIWCESTPGQGSKFSFVVSLGLPVLNQNPDQMAGPGESGQSDQGSQPDQSGPVDKSGTAVPEKVSLEGLRVLLAEDNEINQMIATELLESQGVLVTVVDNGRKAIEALESAPYDLVLMDIQMPEMDGLSATAELRSRPEFADLPIIAMTAHAMSGDRETSLSGGMNDHITKPIEPDLLYRALARWSGKRKPA